MVLAHEHHTRTARRDITFSIGLKGPGRRGCILTGNLRDGPGSTISSENVGRIDFLDINEEYGIRPLFVVHVSSSTLDVNVARSEAGDDDEIETIFESRALFHNGANDVAQVARRDVLIRYAFNRMSIRVLVGYKLRYPVDILIFYDSSQPYTHPPTEDDIAEYIRESNGADATIPDNAYDSCDEEEEKGEAKDSDDSDSLMSTDDENKEAGGGVLTTIELDDNHC